MLGERMGGLTLAEYSETWPKAGMMQNGVCCRRPKWERRIGVIDCGLWPTPKRRTGGGQAIRRTPGGGLRKLEDLCARLGRRDLEKSPEFRECLMGWPMEWTDLMLLEKARFRRWWRQFGGY